MKNWLSNISDRDFSRFREFAVRHPKIVSGAHLLQKLTIFNFVAPIIQKYRPERILEIGCGLGFHSALLSNYGHVFATELEVPGSFVVITENVASNRDTVLQELATRDVDFKANDGRSLPYPNEAFDLIFHNSVIEHVPDPATFNRETGRVLKPNGIVVCITGTPALCWFRLVRDYIFRLPFTIAASLAKETGVTSRLGISDKLKALIPKDTKKPGRLPPVSGWNSRLNHYVNSPAYNAMVLEELAATAGVGTETALVAAHEHLKKSIFNRLGYYLTPQTHGQHYRNFRHEMTEWKIDRWRETFTEAGFDILEVTPYRFHHLLEVSWSDKFNAALYHRAAPYISRFSRSIPAGVASEFILVARKR